MKKLFEHYRIRNKSPSATSRKWKRSLCAPQKFPAIPANWHSIDTGQLLLRAITVVSPVKLAGLSEAKRPCPPYSALNCRLSWLPNACKISCLSRRKWKTCPKTWSSWFSALTNQIFALPTSTVRLRTSYWLHQRLTHLWELLLSISFAIDHVVYYEI